MKWLRRVLVVIIVVVLAALFVKNDGIQYTAAFVSRSWGRPFDAAAYPVDSNCDGQTPCGSGVLKVLTFNVLCRVCEKEGYDPWELRLPHIREVIERYDADLVGLQELGGEGDVYAVIGEGSPYDYVAYEFGPWVYADCALLFRRERFELLDSGQVWLSPKPMVPFALAWKPLSVPRYVNWAHLRQRENGFEFLYVNTHFDNNAPNKEAAASLFAETFGPAARQMPVVATGDFNTNPTAQRYEALQGRAATGTLFENAADLVAKKELAQAATPDEAARTESFVNADQLIDHVFVGGPGDKEVTRWVLEAPVYGPDNRRPSDHPAVYAELSFNLRP